MHPLTDTFNSFNSLLYMACYGVRQYGQVNFVVPGGQLIACGEFGKLTDGYHYLAGNARNPYHQFQFAVKNDTAGVLGFDEVDFMRDEDTFDYGDVSLFPAN
jgi:hypothetical protein